MMGKILDTKHNNMKYFEKYRNFSKDLKDPYGYKKYKNEMWILFFTVGYSIGFFIAYKIIY